MRGGTEWETGQRGRASMASRPAAGMTVDPFECGNGPGKAVL